MEYKGLMIGTPMAGNPTPGMAASMFALQKPEPCIWEQVLGRSADTARNIIVERFLKSNMAWLFFVDADMLFQPETVMRLNSRECDFIAGLCFTRTPTPTPTAYRGITRYTDEGWPYLAVKTLETLEWLLKFEKLFTFEEAAYILPDDPEAVVEFDATGAACLLVHRNVLEAIEPPWFQYTYPDRMVGEDFYFCMKAKAAGFTLYIDRTVLVGHQYGERYIGPAQYITLMHALQLAAQPRFIKILERMAKRMGFAP